MCLEDVFIMCLLNVKWIVRFYKNLSMQVSIHKVIKKKWDIPNTKKIWNSEGESVFSPIIKTAKIIILWQINRMCF